MLRRIATKWVLTVLAAVLVPFLGFAGYVDGKIAERHWETVRHYLLTMAGETASRVDDEVSERLADVETWTRATPITSWTVAEWDGRQAGFRPTLAATFDRVVSAGRGWDLIVAVNADGELVVSSSIDRLGEPLQPEVLAALERDYRRQSWFGPALRGEVVLVDHHSSDLLPPRVRSGVPHPENFHVGFAMPVSDPADPERVVGAVYALLNWSHVQNRVLRKVRPRMPVDGSEVYQTSYTWLWASDGDTILAHPNTALYEKRVSAPPVDLPQLAAAARANDWGMYPEYKFQGRWKNAAFKHCRGAPHGFGWVVGVGIDNEDTYATVNQLRAVLWSATGLVLLVVVVFTILVARRTTRPIVELKAHAERVGAGDLDARVDVTSDDELGDLGRAFNRMTAELKENRARIVKAEKDAAWREMARQVAHEIKNPLTPVLLSANLLDRARRERSPEFDSIFDRTIELIRRQVENMRKIAADFSAFAGARKTNPERVDLRQLVDETVELNAAWAREARVAVEVSGGPAWVHADAAELRRVLINLVSNAFEAMPDGGVLRLAIARAGGRVLLSVEDDGVGLSDTVRARLFEPYFTTRSHGTGLGLAISRRIVEELGGTIHLEPRAEGRGTLARIELPELAGEAAA
ncbi:MAG: HAMP domain-containing protein [Planctomycetes bacterium]|nr:HAMP domain-containing protein [Planctomycetota bacterium]